MGLSTTSVGAEGVDGEEKAYVVADAWTLMSRYGSSEVAMMMECVQQTLEYRLRRR